MAFKKGHEVPTIDVALVTISTKDSDTEIALNTASNIQVSVNSETEDPVQLIIKGRLIAQKPSTTTITGHAIVLTDNVFNAEVVKVLQGGTIKYYGDFDQQTESDVDLGYGIKSYTPPVAGSSEKGEIFVLNAYSAIYNAAGLLTGYERISYPNCQGTPVALSSEDGAFRAPEYTINSAPDTGEAPYEIVYVKELPEVTDVPVADPLKEIKVVACPEQDLLGKNTSALQEGVVISGTSITGTLNHQTDYTGFSSISGEQEGYYFALQVIPPKGADLSQSTLMVWEKAMNPQDDGGKPILIKRLKDASGSSATGTFNVMANWGAGEVTQTYTYNFTLKGE